MKSNRITIQDIANHARVSKATVSRVLNDHGTVNAQKRDAVLAAMGSLDFQPNQIARGLAGGRSMTIGILTQNIGTPFYDAVIRGIINGLAGTGYSPIFVDGQFKQDLEQKVIQTLLGRSVDGLILVGGDLPVDQLEQLRHTAPTIVVARELPQWGDHCVSMDNLDAGYQATKYLVDAGHRQIAHIKGNSDHEDAVRRYEGYCQALADAKLPLDEELVYPGNFYGQAGVLAVESWLMRGKNFTAIFAANDLSALGARLALYRRNIRVPDEISIIGVDDQLEAAFMTPPLTTIRQPAEPMGAAAAEALLALMNGREYKLPTLRAELIRRESVCGLH